ncbi:MAG: adenylylsulfate kinase [Lachnospiraceae bacterium]|nr:adenylylsulfate kinase [Lachnospiraceae bacterium]
MLEKLTKLLAEGYDFPEITPDIPHGDMPGDKIEIGESHIAKAKVIFPELLKELQENGKEKAVLCVCGGSGVGKSEIASVLGYYLSSLGIRSYVLSGDNYPRRIPKYNDAERLNTFRRAGIRGMLLEGVYTEERGQVLRELQEREVDPDPKLIAEYPWLSSYIEYGKEALRCYLGTTQEIDFEEISGILAAFKEGKECIFLKRMGRTETELWYSAVDFSETEVLIVEWTHGNSDYLKGVDIPILLNSTPEETLAHRRARNRDGKIDSAFTTMVLGIEQKKLHEQARKAAIIVSKDGALLDFAAYSALMDGQF